MSDQFTLVAEKREITGKKVKMLRREGLVPIVVYGPSYDSTNLQVKWTDLRHVLVNAGGTQIINLDVAGETVPTLARYVQRNPIRGDVLHVDFYRVDMNRPIRAEVPLLAVGETEIVEVGTAIITQNLTNVEVEALPANLPQQIDVDISGLVEIGDSILVQDLNLPAGVTIPSVNPDDMVLKLDYAQALLTEEEEEAEDSFLEESAEVEVLTERKDDAEEEYED